MAGIDGVMEETRPSRNTPHPYPFHEVGSQAQKPHEPHSKLVIEVPDTSFFNAQQTFEIPGVKPVMPAARLDTSPWSPSKNSPGYETQVFYTPDTENRSRYVATSDPNLIKKGGMSRIVPAWDRKTGRYVALKITPIDNEGGRESRHRAHLEAQTQAHASAFAAPVYDFFVLDKTTVFHDNKVFPSNSTDTDPDAFEQPGVDYAVMVLPLYKKEDSLLYRIKNNQLGVRDIKVIATDLALAIDEMGQTTGDSQNSNKVRIFHRDLKPGNLFLVDNHVRIIDFGIANTTAYMGQLDASTPSFSNHEQLTSSERITGAAVESELQTVAIILFSAICNKTPGQVLTEEYGGEDTPASHAAKFAIYVDGLTSKMKDELTAGMNKLGIIPSQQPDVLSFFDKMFKKDKMQRYQTGNAFQKAFTSAFIESNSSDVSAGDTTITDANTPSVNINDDTVVHSDIATKLHVAADTKVR